jgi:hypothetical protein
MGDMTQAILPGCDTAESEYSQPSAIPPCVCGCGRPRLLSRRKGRSPRDYASNACRARIRNRRIAQLVALGAKFASQRALPGESKVERAFEAWVTSEDGRIVEAEVVRRARRLLANGKTRFGIAALWEAMRYDAAVDVSCGEWKLDNSYRSLLARRVMTRYSDLEGFFETRELRGRVA